MSARAVGVFFAALLIIRIGNHRIFGKNSAFDIVLGIIYGSILSRTITGNSPFWPTIAAAFVLVMLHKLLASFAFHTHFGLGAFIKGRPKALVKDGKMQRKAMEESSVTENDLKEAVRSSGTHAGVDRIQHAYLERSGKISIILKNDDEA
ncbi:DUF421 domain-containing protein [Pontibacter anaerobius]|uniref:DUF421 domain-containing protein n=1 Tax=Pontibacter anaerobius TaxID=2993940 RepID=A0ABT3RB44_9BACT|nr:YetF domain-containing protein [Pontibacter anaerobius]MCX2738651.1 DUF421 domain-containing protein [Pontibacter anaerobius]